MKPLRIRIDATAEMLPGRSVSTAEVLQASGLDRTVEEIVQKTGIECRHWADPKTPLPELAAQALQQAIDASRFEAKDLRRIILANCTGAEFQFPGSANKITAELGLAGSCDCFDINNACMGYLTALDLAARSVATGLGPVGVVAAELCSRHITPKDPRPYLVFGDGIAACVVSEANSGGILSSFLANDGTLGDHTTLRNGNLSDGPETIRFDRSNREMTDVALSKLVQATLTGLAQVGLSMSDIDWVLPHQPNGSMFDQILQRLEVPEERAVKIVHQAGSVGSSAIGVSLNRLRSQHGLQPGQRVLLVGVGAGVSFGSIVYEEPAWD